MFDWKVENMSLKNGNKINGRFYAEYTTSQEDKLAFVDSMQDGALSYIIGIIKKFQEEKDQLPTYSNGRYNVKSFRSWIKQNDPRGLINSSDAYSELNGYFSLCDWGGDLQYSSIKGDNVYVDAANFVDKCFHGQLVECEQLERKYFVSHDEYCILLIQIIDGMKRHLTSFGVKLATNSSRTDPEVWVYSDKQGDDIFLQRRRISIDEARILAKKYKELEAYIDKLSSDISITCDGEK